MAGNGPGMEGQRMSDIAPGRTIRTEDSSKSPSVESEFDRQAAFISELEFSVDALFDAFSPVLKIPSPTAEGAEKPSDPEVGETRSMVQRMLSDNNDKIGTQIRRLVALRDRSDL